MRPSRYHDDRPRGRRHGPPDRRPQDRRPAHERRVREELTRLIGLLVDEPDQVDVRDERDRNGIRFDVRVAPQDLGKVIGRQGRTAWALRTLLDVRGAQDRRRYGLEIRDARSRR